MSYEADAVNYINSFHIKDPTNDELSEESRLELDAINSLFWTRNRGRHWLFKL